MSEDHFGQRPSLDHLIEYTDGLDKRTEALYARMAEQTRMLSDLERKSRALLKASRELTRGRRQIDKNK